MSHTGGVYAVTTATEKRSEILFMGEMLNAENMEAKTTAVRAVKAGGTKVGNSYHDCHCMKC